MLPDVTETVIVENGPNEPPAEEKVESVIGEGNLNKKLFVLVEDSVSEPTWKSIHVVKNIFQSY